jgi:hypothetical protein
MIAIQTKYIPASNTKGSRIKAYIEDGGHKESVTIGYPYELSGIDCHWAAAEKLIRKLEGADTHGETVTFVAGGTRYGYVFVVSAVGGRAIAYRTFAVKASK